MLQLILRTPGVTTEIYTHVDMADHRTTIEQNPLAAERPADLTPLRKLVRSLRSEPAEVDSHEKTGNLRLSVFMAVVCPV